MMPLIIASCFIGGRPRRLLVGAAGLLLFVLASPVWAQVVGPPPVSDRVLTNISEIWEMPPEHKGEEFRIRTEMVIYYFDTIWGNAEGECLGTPRWLPIFDSPIPLKAGQRIAIDGIIVPQRERFVWDKTRIHILEENTPLKALPVSDLAQNSQELKDHLVAVEGLIDSETEDATHCILNFLSGNSLARTYVLHETNQSSFHFKAGDFVRMKCVYSPQFDKNGNLSDLTLWVSSPADIETISSLKTDARFDIPLTFSQDIQPGTAVSDLIRVAGIVRSSEPGKWVTLWDATGQIMVQSKQSQPLRFGDHIEAIGHPYVLGVQQFLRDGLYRLTDPTNPAVSSLTNAGGTLPSLPLRLAEQIRDLSPEEAGRHLPVKLHAVVGWSHSSTPFAYVQDGSGGIRVNNPKWDEPGTEKPGTIVLLEGVTDTGDFVPVVTNAVLRRAGWWNMEPGRLVSLEQALTGVEDGHWIEMRGFVRELRQTNGLVCFDLSTSSGEFQAWTPAMQSFDALKGSVVRVSGVCSTVSNARHQLTGIQIWVGDVKYLETEEAAPYDLFAVPLRPLDGLRRFNMESALNQRIRTAGTVVFHAPGRYLCVQEGRDSIFVLSQQLEPLHPGDRVEVVGFSGSEGRKFLLREAVYRRISTGPEPAPVPLAAMHSVNLDLEGLLAKAQGTLLNRVEKDGETRLLIQTTDSAFEVSLDSTTTEAAKQLQALKLGSRLALTGVYEVQSDKYGQPRSFLLHLRSGNDVQLLERPPWWTFARLLWVLLGLMVVFALALFWSFLISRKNKLLRHAQTELLMANDKLELRVEERTQELRKQVVAKEQARAELAEAQKSLMHASRQAGMAEVATGVLHNVGNVLNSVNVSTFLILETLRKSKLRNLGRLAATIREHRDNLAAFFTTDPRGRQLPDYIPRLAEHLTGEQAELVKEVESLANNIEHIKVIVGMQQGHAKAGGVLEALDPTSLVEDALQINRAALDRHAIQLVRDYHPVPQVLMDRHKVLQILVNLISNAKHALKEKESDKQVIFTIRAAGPDRVHLIVSDNGVGIASENLVRIFSQGFTTRRDGHGFGLHSGANAAKEIGGSLTVHSDGLDRGATFTLELPVASGAH